MASNSITDIRNANCVYVQGTTSDCGVSGYSPAGKDVNVSYHFGVLLRYGLAVFIGKRFSLRPTLFVLKERSLPFKEPLDQYQYSSLLG